MHRAALTCHPATPCVAVRRIEATVRGTADGGLALEYVLDGDIGAVLVPARAAPGRADRLWQHTCFEAFLAREGEPAYFEYNLAPSQQWALYRFAGYRDAMTAAEPAHAPRIRVETTPRRLRFDTEIDAPLRAQRMALCAVVEDTDRRLSYWALAHPAGKPDFHHADGFALRLECTR